jgi:hypothetical protein
MKFAMMAIPMNDDVGQEGDRLKETPIITSFVVHQMRRIFCAV